jgi:hypothetical protein
LETLNLIGNQLGLSGGGGFWGAIGDLNNDFATLGFFIVGIFVAAWLISYVMYRAKLYDELGAPPNGIEIACAVAVGQQDRPDQGRAAALEPPAPWGSKGPATGATG